ncbi:hypothetical protein GcM3_102006 [Golovinomyces cichoracearum]|uniref:Phosphoribosylaminoimidazole-succinocarboxamide synthase n=1 Tax=Golovinomyces cichoracearum TaxID=62708 RepID=A0A420IA40_9PEZI|nr:hypothetical protein GcM3_102006 [Golovinomyces cichoracearum]
MEFRGNESNYDHRNNWSRQGANSDFPFTSRNSWFEDDRCSSLTSVLSTPTTVIRWNNTRKFPPYHLRSRTQSLDRSVTPKTVASTDSQRSLNERHIVVSQNSIRHPHDDNSSNEAYSYLPPTQESLTSQDGTSRSRNIWMSEDTSLDSSLPTPVDNTPYIRFAIEQLTCTEQSHRHHNRPSSSLIDSADSTINPIAGNHENTTSFPIRNIHLSSTYYQLAKETYNNILPGQNSAYMTPEKEREGMALTRKYRSRPSAAKSLSLYPPSMSDSMSNRVGSYPIPSNVNSQIPAFPIELRSDSKNNPQLTFVPAILRFPSIAILSLLCIIMIALLLLCAIYSKKYNGLLDFCGSVSSIQYVLLKFGPQLFACLIFLYVQSVISAITRIMPFTVLAINDATRRRSNEIFTRIYPVFLRPTRVGNLRIDICLFLLWLSVFTIPLQSCLFSINLMSSNPRWVTFQGAAWTLIFLYTFILGSTLIIGIFFFHRTTGLIWDPRSLADIVSILSQSNSLQAFSGTDILKSEEEIRQRLGVQRYRLGYWKQENTLHIFYALDQIVETTSHSKASKSPKKESNRTRGDARDCERIFPGHDYRTRYRFISWYLRDLSLIMWSVICFILWIDLVLVSCLPLTAMRKGFLPSISASVDPQGFAPASFWVSFGSSLLGMLLYLFFQTFDMRLRILKPWAELSKFNGSTADRSLLLDYPAALPICVSLSAFSASHYMICIISLLSTIFILLPIICSGIFYPAINFPTGEIKFVPNKAVIIIFILLLSLYLVGILLFINKADRIYLPHDVSCLAEIISFLYNSHILGDATFRKVYSKVEFSNRLLAHGTNCGTGMGTAPEISGPDCWAFGVFKGRNGKDSMGIERLGRSPGVGLMVMSAR